MLLMQFLGRRELEDVKFLREKIGVHVRLVWVFCE